MANCATTFITLKGPGLVLERLVEIIEAEIAETNGKVIHSTLVGSEAQVEILGPRGEEFSHLIDNLPASVTAAAEVWPEMGGQFHLAVRKNGQDLGNAAIELWEIAKLQEGFQYLWRSADRETALLLLTAAEHDFIGLPGDGRDVVIQSEDYSTTITRLDDESVRVETSFGHIFPKVSHAGEVLQDPICQPN